MLGAPQPRPGEGSVTTQASNARAGGPTGIERFAYDPDDGVEARRKKNAIFVVAGGCTIAGGVWTAMYALVFGWGLTAALPLSFSAIVGSALAVSHAKRTHTYAVYAQILCILYITAFIQWSIGDVFASGFVLVWSFIAPVTALAFFPLRKASLWFLLYLVNLAVTLAFDDTFRRHGLAVDGQMRIVFFAMNLGVSSLVVFFFASYFAQSAETLRARADELEESLEQEKAKQLGPYTLEGKLGSGGMGVVYRARHALLRRPTAVKMIQVERVGEESLLRFEREVQLTAKLSHPSTVAIHDYGRTTDGVFYYAMECLDGVDLETLVRRAGALPASRVVCVLEQVCGALEEAHHHGLVHRDIKPANIMLCRLGNRPDVAKVLDFGLVKELASDDKVTRDDVIAGTPAYLAPEAITDPSTVGPRADLYALGAVAYWLLTGRTVFSGSTVVEVLAHHLHTAPDPPSSHVDGIPEELDRLILTCLAKQPSERPATVRALRRLLLDVSLDEGWTEEAAHAWWDSFEDSRLRDEAPPSSGFSQTLDVDWKNREDVAAASAVRRTHVDARRAADKRRR